MLWFLLASGPNAGEAFLFAMGPMECETTGPCFTQDEQTLFLAVQHPGEINRPAQKSSRRRPQIGDANHRWSTVYANAPSPYRLELAGVLTFHFH